MGDVRMGRARHAAAKALSASAGATGRAGAVPVPCAGCQEEGVVTTGLEQHLSCCNDILRCSGLDSIQPGATAPPPPVWLRPATCARATLARLRAQDAAAGGGVGLRMSEMNSAVNGGRAGMSEVLGAALWTADTAFE